MSATRFRKLALSLDGAEEKSHMDHPDFRVGGRIFATLRPGEKHGVVMVTPEEQALLIEAAPDVFRPVNGAWGQKGATELDLAKANATSMRSALTMAWRIRAAAKPKVRRSTGAKPGKKRPA